MRPLNLLCSLALTCGVAFAAEPAAISPGETVSLFNGKDLSSFTTWETVHGKEDPDRVFTVVEQIDGAPAIRASGQHWGGLITKERYANYHLVFEYRWGLVTWGQRKDRARDAGVLLHCQGEEGNYQKDFKAPWMRSVEYQIIEGASGDLILVGGYDRATGEFIMPAVKGTFSMRGQLKVWDPKGEPGQFGKGNGRIHVGYKTADWKDVLGFRGPNDVEKPIGQWNRAEAIVDNGKFTYFLNGVKVNEFGESTFREGRLLFQSEGAEIYYRKIELRPVKK
jgi:hypothetical protein